MDFPCRENPDKSLVDNLSGCCYCEGKFIEKVMNLDIVAGFATLLI
jgi:hypothetical protein